MSKSVNFDSPIVEALVLVEDLFNFNSVSDTRSPNILLKASTTWLSVIGISGTNFSLPPLAWAEPNIWAKVFSNAVTNVDLSACVLLT